jgi:DNA-binding CsgD family transcriptional regulator
MPDCVELPGQSVEQLVKADCSFFYLSLRQRQCLELAAHGCTNFAIALRLSISQRTVEQHLDRARINLQALTTAHAIAIAVKKQLIEIKGVSNV